MKFESEQFVLKPRECIHVKIDHKIQKHDHDMDVWQAAIPCSGVKLRIEWSKKWDLRFAFEAFHPNAEDLISSDGTEKTECWKELILDEPFMARHGLRFWWSSGEPKNRGARVIEPTRVVPPVEPPAAK